VRGYRTNQLARDEGYSGSLEYRRPLFANSTGWRNLQAALFVDRGWAKNKDEAVASPGLTGLGAGLVWSPSPRYSAELYFAHGTTNVPNAGSHSRQDQSFYFRFAVFPFRPG
jgi:hemolysin activation/secretion protein